MLPFSRAGTIRLPATGARFAALLLRPGARSPRRAAARLLRHAGSAALLAALLRAWTSALLGLRLRTASSLELATKPQFAASQNPRSGNSGG